MHESLRPNQCSSADEQPDTAEGKIIVDYSLDVDYERSEPKIEPDAQEEKEENLHEYGDTLQCHIPLEDVTSQCYAEDPVGTIRASPEIMALWLHDM